MRRSNAFTGFGFGQHSFTVPAGLYHYQTTLDLRPNGIDLLVPITLDENPMTGAVNVTFGSLDPMTMQYGSRLSKGSSGSSDNKHDLNPNFASQGAKW